MKTLKEWLTGRKVRSERRAEIKSEIENIIEMQRLNRGVRHAAINSGNWPSENYGPDKYFDYAAGIMAINELTEELNSTK
jgi:hypothetical protein